MNRSSLVIILIGWPVTSTLTRITGFITYLLLTYVTVMVVVFLLLRTA